MIGGLTSKLLGGALVLSLVTLGPALLITRGKLADARETITALTEWQDNLVFAVQIATENDEVDKYNALEQVQRLGVIRIQLKDAVDQQNSAIEAMAQETAAARAVAAQAERQRRAAIARTEALQAELRNRARVPAPAQDMEAAVRRTQDEQYEAGI